MAWLRRFALTSFTSIFSRSGGGYRSATWGRSPERMVLMGLKHQKWWRKMGEMTKMASLSKEKMRIHQTRSSFIHWNSDLSGWWTVDFLPQKALWLSPKLTLCLVQLQFLPQAQDRKHLAEAPFKNRTKMGTQNNFWRCLVWEWRLSDFRLLAIAGRIWNVLRSVIPSLQT